MAKRHRSSKSGRFVTAKKAKRSKSTTVSEKVKKRHVLGVGYPWISGPMNLTCGLNKAPCEGNEISLLDQFVSNPGTILKRPRALDCRKKYRLVLEEL